VLLILLATLVAALPLGLLFWLGRWSRRAGGISPRTTWLLAAAGALLGALAAKLEQWALGISGLSLDASEVGVGASMVAMFLFASPLGQALKVAAVWPLYRYRAITRPALGLTYAAAAGAGFGAAHAVASLIALKLDTLLLVRLALGAPAHLFFAGVWGYALGSERARGRWFGLSWGTAVLVQGLYEHIVFGRGPGLLVAAVPLLLAMALVSWVTLRDIAPAPDSLLPSSRASLIPTLPDPPSLGAVRRALSRVDRPLMVHWVAIGVLVTFGVMLVALAVAVCVGHEVGVDFATADEGDVRSTGPLLLLGVAFLSAFPIAGYLVARASSASSVLEPALSAGFAILGVVALVSMASPVSVVFALAVAPVALVLACSGAWFGLVR
jgi:hypothetical protein